MLGANLSDQVPGGPNLTLTLTLNSNQEFSQEWPRQTKPKKGQFMNFSQGRSGTKVQCESCLFSQGKTPEFTKMGEIHELFVLALFLVWFAGATPDFLELKKDTDIVPKFLRVHDWAIAGRYGWDFPEEIPEKFRKDPGNALRAFPGILLESTASMPQTL